MKLLPQKFWNQPAPVLARALLGKTIRRRVSWGGRIWWLAARIIETEAYEIGEKASHASLGRTPSREPLFMPPGTIYMYYARGGDSLNFSARGAGNAVLIKSGYPLFDQHSRQEMLLVMQALNPGSQGPRPLEKLCSGQTLLCRSLNLKVPEWTGKQLEKEVFRIEAAAEEPASIVSCRRLGIPPGRDEHLMYRFVDRDFVRYCTRNPLTVRGATAGRDFFIE